MVYYAKPFEVVSQAIYDVNPALFHGIASKVGRVPITLQDPWNDDFIHYNVLRKAVKSRVGDAPGWDAVPDSTFDPGVRKAKWFYWNHELSEKHYKSLQMNPNGPLAQQIQSELVAQQDYFMANVDLWLNGYLYANTVDDYDAEFVPLLHLKAASGTVTDPQDLNSTPGTANDYTATKLTGPTTTVDAINTSFGLAKEVFFQQYDANTHQGMYKEGGNTFSVILHPAVIEKLKRGHLSAASGELDYSLSVYDNLVKEFELIPSYSTDAAYDGAAATEAQFTMAMNMKDNFQIIEAVPYTVEPWVLNPATHTYQLRAYWKVFTMTSTYYMNSYWRKACLHGRITPYATA